MNLRPTDVDYAIQLLYRLKNLAHHMVDETTERQAQRYHQQLCDIMETIGDFLSEPTPQNRRHIERSHVNSIPVDQSTEGSK